MSSGAIGEKFVLCELMRRGLCGLTSPDPTNENWDIVIFNEAAKVGVTLQVKTSRWPSQGSNTKATLTGNFSGNYDFLVIVVIDYPDSENYLIYVVEKSQIVDSGSGKGGIPTKRGEKFKFKNRSIPFSTFSSHKQFFDTEFKNNWSCVKKLLTLRSSGTPQKRGAP